VPIAAGALLALFEAALIYRTWLATRELGRLTADRSPAGPGPSPDPSPDPKKNPQSKPKERVLA
jgi:hypothetical protein